AELVSTRFKRQPLGNPTGCLLRSEKTQAISLLAQLTLPRQLHFPPKTSPRTPRSLHHPAQCWLLPQGCCSQERRHLQRRLLQKFLLDETRRAWCVPHAASPAGFPTAL